MELRRLIRDTCQPDRVGFVLPLMNLHPVEIGGWAMYERITTALTLRELQQAYALRKPPGGLMHHSDRGSKYTSRAYRKQLSKYGIRSSMSGKGNCYDNAIFERFFGSLKDEGFASVVHLTREGIVTDVNECIRYYNGARLHSALGYTSPNEHEKPRINVCNLTNLEQGFQVQTVNCYPQRNSNGWFIPLKVEEIFSYSHKQSFISYGTPCGGGVVEVQVEVSR
ncbi:MAG: hypothetical protein ACJA2Q_002725, partial [Pseudohongiellaceae bacterium]|jgi:hypothetical protein